MHAQQRQPVDRGGAQPGPAANDVHLRQHGQEMLRTREHRRQHGHVQRRINGIELAGRTDQPLPGWPCLHIECHRGAAAGMRAGAVSQLTTDAAPAADSDR